MKGLIQRVSSASVTVDDEVVGQIGRGVLLFLGVEQQDDESVGCRLLERVVGYRIFPDDDGRMNRGLTEVGGDLLIVSQFTLAADTRKGRRPSFSSSASPEQAERLYGAFVERARALEGTGGGLNHVATGIFAADMQVSLNNDGPVTFLLEV